MRIRRLIVAGALISTLAGGGITGCQAIGGTTSPAPASGGAMQLTVISVQDGDDFTGKTAAGKKIKVRLLGIDAPEISHDGNPADCGGTAAAAALNALLYRKHVTVTTDPRSDGTDRYGRTLGYVDVAGVDAALSQVQSGLAEAWYPSSAAPPDRYASYKAAQVQAQRDRTGQWASCVTLGR